MSPRRVSGVGRADRPGRSRALGLVRALLPGRLRPDRVARHFAGVWNILANTRILDLLTRGGIVALTDTDQGLVYGVPDPQYYVASQDPVDWDLVLLAGLMFLTMWGVKAAPVPRARPLCRHQRLAGSARARVSLRPGDQPGLAVRDRQRCGWPPPSRARGPTRTRLERVVPRAGLRVLELAAFAALWPVRRWADGLGERDPLAARDPARAYLMTRPERGPRQGLPT